MSRSNSQTTDISSISTISDLYKNSRLHSNSPDTSSNQPSSTLNSKVSLVQTSITTLAVTSIVNAANNSLLGGGGVDGAIHRSAGPSLLAECRTLSGCATGAAKITSAYNLPSKYVIHTVGPIYQNADASSKLLANCYRNSLQLAAQKGGSVAFSCVSTGIYGYPSLEAAEIATTEVRRFLVEQEKNQGEDGKGKLERVIFCCFEDKDVRAYEKWLPRTFPPTDSELPTSSSSSPSSDSKISSDAIPTAVEPQATPNPNNLTPLDEHTTEDWEKVEKPEDIPAAVQPSELSDEGVEVDAVNSDLGVSEVASETGKEEDKNEEKGEGKTHSYGLLKDW